jgi:hypothetical protein
VGELVRRPNRVVENSIVTFGPKRPQENGSDDHPGAAELVKFPGDPIREDPLLPRKRTPGAAGVPRSNQHIHDMNAPLPSTLDRGAFPKSVQDGLISASGTHRTTDIDNLINTPTPHIHCDRAMPSEPK